MSVSARDRKVVIYGELERMRELYARKEEEARALREENAELRAKLKAPRASSNGFRATLARMHELTAKYNTTARLKDGKIQLFSKKRGAWLDAPSEAQA